MKKKTTELLRTVEKRTDSEFRDIRLTDRDLEILKFGLEMKFFSIETVTRKFFPETYLTRNLNGRYPKERIWRLLKAGLISSHRLSFKARAFYLVTERGHQALTIARPAMARVNAPSSLDIRTFHHDQYVIEARLQLETAGRANRWDSERVLKSHGSSLKGLSREYMPDAVFLNAQGDEMALELEISLKSERRYREKIAKFEEMIHESMIQGFGVTKILFVCVTKESFEVLSRLINRGANQMRVMRFTDLAALQPIVKVSHTQSNEISS